MSLTLNVGDLMQEAGKEDVIEEDNIPFSRHIPNITKDGVSFVLHLQSLNDQDILVTFREIHAHLQEVSDISLQTFERPVDVYDYQVKYTTEQSYVDDEEVFLLPPKSFRLDLSAPLCQAIQLQEPVVQAMKGELS